MTSLKKQKLISSNSSIIYESIFLWVRAMLQNIAMQLIAQFLLGGDQEMTLSRVLTQICVFLLYFLLMCIVFFDIDSIILIKISYNHLTNNNDQSYYKSTCIIIYTIVRIIQFANEKCTLRWKSSMKKKSNVKQSTRRCGINHP